MTLTQKLLEWYKKNGRELPWRVKSKAHPSPYEVWISEIMLQQTTVKTVLPYFDRFLKQFPNVFALANANIDDVLLMWQGLGYYTRARKMHECAQKIVETYGGIFPNNLDDLKKLPGIGPYTSASIMAFGFNKRAAVVDGNVIRVLCRVKGFSENVTDILPKINALAWEMTPEKNNADYSSAIMDLGATVCMPKNPTCATCPWNADCIALKKNKIDKIPALSKLPKVIKQGYVFLITDSKGRIYIRKRTEKGLLSGLFELPWNTDRTLLFDDNWERTNKTVKHVFTHFTLTLEILKLTSDSVSNPSDGLYVDIADLKQYPLSTLMKKVLRYL